MATESSPIESGLTFTATQNPYRKTDPELQREIDAGETGLQALQARYANPNWFNVAAGFFKPQLGGFSASLGSASQALGDWQEKQRANELPVYNARAQLALLKNKMDHRQKAAALYQQGTEQGFTQGMVNEIVGHDSENFGPKASAAYKQQQDTQGKAREQTMGLAEFGVKPGVSAGLANRVAGALTPYDNPGFKLGDANSPVNTGEIPAATTTPAATVTPAAVAAGLALGDATSPVNTGKIGGGKKQGVFTMPEEEGSGTSTETTKIKNANVTLGASHAAELANAAQEAQSRIANLAQVYPLLNKPGVKEIMGRTENGSIHASLITALENQGVSGAVASVAAKLIPPGTSPEIASDIRQILTASAKEQLAVNNATTHPTLTTQKTEKIAAFSILDPSPAAMKNIRLTLHDLQLPIRLAPVAHELAKKGTEYQSMLQDSAYNKILQDYQQRHTDLGSRTPTNILPSDLDPSQGAFSIGKKHSLATQLGIKP